MPQKDSASESKLELIKELKKCGCLKYGQFTLKSGDISDYYIDLREATLHPKLFHMIIDNLKNIIPHRVANGEIPQDQTVAIAGVPYGVVPIASVVAYELNIPYYPVRKEEKGYGRKIDLEQFKHFDFTLIEDVMSTGSSIIDTMKKLEGLNVTDVIVVVDRGADGEQNIRKVSPNTTVRSILKASDIMNSLS